MYLEYLSVPRQQSISKFAEANITLFGLSFVVMPTSGLFPSTHIRSENASLIAIH